MNSDMEHNSIEPSGEFASSIRDFRSAVTHVANRLTALPVSANFLAPARKRRRLAQTNMVLGWACAALLCFATLPFATLPFANHSHPAAVLHPAVTTVVAPARSADSDTALLEQVDSDVSESVPSSLAPLSELDNWNSTSTNNSSESYDNGSALR
jgi:hypothetical protein